MRVRALLLALALALGPPITARAEPFAPDFPAPATLSASRQEALTSHRFPTGPFAGGALPVETVEGALDQTAWRVAAPGQTTLQLLAPLRDQLAREGWRVIYDCETAACGGFDFRYGMDVMPEPDMHVDLSDFRYLSAERGAGAARQVVALLVSRSAVTGFVQVTQVARVPPSAANGGPVDDPSVPNPPDDQVPPDPDRLDPDPQSGLGGFTDIGAQLQAQGATALDDLVFASGSATLTDGDYGSLAALAAWLEATPGARVALVGHTDASGSLAANVALSRRRAEAVRDRLVETFGIDPARVAADGVGPLAPRASNLTEEGRTRNRRVEVVLTPTP